VDREDQFTMRPPTDKQREVFDHFKHWLRIHFGKGFKGFDPTLHEDANGNFLINGGTMKIIFRLNDIVTIFDISKDTAFYISRSPKLEQALFDCLVWATKDSFVNGYKP
jgi:hypothetical protein